MTISRKRFIKISSLFAGVVLIPGKGLGNFLLQQEPGIRSLRRGTGIYTERGGTIGWYLSDDFVIGIDTQFPDSAKNFMDRLRKETNRNIDVLFNTHHHGDHTAGNYYLRNYVDKIVAHENCPVLQKKAYDKGENAGKQVYADTTFTEAWKKNLGNDIVRAIYLGPAHTGGDIVIHFQNADVAHVGDLVFNKIYPYIDDKGGGSIKGWISVLQKIEETFPKTTIFIFGHAVDNESVVGTINDIARMKDYFDSLLNFVQKGINEGKGVEELSKAEAIPGFNDIKEAHSGSKKMNIERAFNELNL